VLEVGPDLPSKESKQTALPSLTDQTPPPNSIPESLGKMSGAAVSGAAVTMLQQQIKLANKVQRQLSKQLRAKVPAPNRRLTSVERYLAQYILQKKDAPSRFLLRHSIGAIKHYYGQHAVMVALVIGLSTRDFKLVEASLNHFTNDELKSISGSWLYKLQARIETKEIELREFILEQAHLHEPAPQDQSLKEIAYHLLSGLWVKKLETEADVTEIDTRDIADSKDLLKWLHQHLVLRLKDIMRSNPEAARPFIDKAITLLSDLLKSAGVEEVTKTAIELAAIGPGDPALHQFLAHCEKWSGRLENARALLERALAMPNADPIGYFELSEVLEFLGDDTGAIKAARKGQAHISDAELFLKNPGCMTMPAGPLMRQGDLIAGWQQYQKRRDRFVLAAPNGTAIWQGEPLQDKTLLVLAEKGVGDEIRYASCYPDLLARVQNVAVSADPRLIPLLARSLPDVTFIPAARNTVRNWRKKSVERQSFRLSRALSLDLYCLANQFDHLCMAGDLPLYLRRERSAFPRHQGYLVPDPVKRDIWRARLAELGPGLKVGLSWRSASKNYKRDQHYFSLDQLLPILQVQGVHFVNLQYDECEAELDALERKPGISVHRWDGADIKDDLDGVAALIKELDLVIAPHTMVKELAGAVGTPTLFMVPTGQAWVRWRADPETKEDIWHPSVRHLQSVAVGGKDEVIAKTAAQLQAAVDAKGVSPDWRQHPTGLHRMASKGGAKKSSAMAAIEESLSTNELGETYSPAGKDRFPDKMERNREWESREAAFRQACGELFNGLAQPASPKGVLLVCNLGSIKQDALTLLSAHGLLKDSWAVVSLDESPFDPGHNSNPAISYFHHILVPGTVRRHYRHRYGSEELHFQWEVSWGERICRAEGINFYPIIANRLGKEFHRYAVDVEDPKVAARLETLIKTCDSTLRVCLDVEERLAPLGLPVRFTGFEPNYPATGVFKVYCGERGWRHGIEFVEIRQSYEKYFRAGRAGFVTAIDVQNVTRHRIYGAAGVRPDQFEVWLKENGGDSAVVKRAEGWVKQNRSGYGEPTVEGAIVLERIRRHRARGGKVACLYGCIPFDFGHPWMDEGPAHRDLVDWYNHTVETLNDTDVLLLVKPHPSETDVEQFGQPEMFFLEMLDVPTARNISLLGHHWLNNDALIPHLDFGITWRGTIGTELALMGVPVVVCGRYSMTDRVLDFPAPNDRADYEDMLLHPERIRLSDGLKHRAAMIFEFYRTVIMTEYRIGWIGSKKQNWGPPVLSERAIAEYRKNGHASVDKLCRIFMD